MTFRHFVPGHNSTPDGLIKLQELSGKMRVRSGYRKYQSSIDGPMVSGSYRVLDRDCASVVIRYCDPIWDWQLRQIFFEEDHYWFSFWGMREFVRRVTPEK